MRLFKYIEPVDEKGKPVVITVTEKDIEKWWDDISKLFSDDVLNRFKREYGGIENYPLEEKIKDHMALNWSWEVHEKDDLMKKIKGRS